MRSGARPSYSQRIVKRILRKYGYPPDNQEVGCVAAYSADHGF
jgi:hypothetical protein